MMSALVRADTRHADTVAKYFHGHPKAARRLLWKAFLRYPPSLFVKRHLYFRLRQLIGPAKYERLRDGISEKTENTNEDL